MNATAEIRPLVLSVDDEPNILRAIKRTLRRCDIEVHTADSGAAALTLMQQHEFDVILSDMRMPEMTGAQFLAEAVKLQPNSKRVLLTGYSDLQSTIDAINKGGVSTYLTKPWDDQQLISIVEDAVKLKKLEQTNSSLEALTQQQNEELKALNSSLEQKVEERTARLEQALSELTGSYDTMVALLASVAAMRDEHGSEQNDNKLTLVLAMAQLLSFDGDTKRDLEHAMVLHRIGRLSLADDLLGKPYLQLDTAERKLFDQHPVLAEAVLMGVPQLNQAATLIRHQNERWDGDGFPDQLQGEDIPLGARVVAVARDYFDLCSGLYDHKSMSPAEASEFIQTNAGDRYDPAVVDVFVKAVAELDAASGADGEMAVQPHNLKRGMVLARDVKTEGGVMLLRKGHELSDSLIEKIIKLTRDADTEVDIFVDKRSVA